MPNKNDDEFLEYIKRTPIPNLLRVLYCEYLNSIKFIQMMGLEDDYLDFCKELKVESEYPTFIEGAAPKEVTFDFVEQIKKTSDWKKTDN